MPPKAPAILLAPVIAEIRARLFAAATAPTEADALLAEAQQQIALAAQKIATARALLPKASIPSAPSDGAAVDLAPFAWTRAGGKVSDPSNLPAGAAFGVGTEGGKTYCQWHWAALILHAVAPASAESITGTTAAWYHFTDAAQDGGKPYPPLAARYVWKLTHTAKEAKTGIVWHRWTAAGVKP